MKFTRIPETTFQKLQLNAGILLSDFTPGTGTVEEEDILGATSGGVNFVATPEFSDFGEDIDNAPVNVLELKRLDSWEVTMSGTFVTVDVNLAKTLVGIADIDTSDKTLVKPRNDLLTTDFKDIWWVGDYSDKTGATNGGFVAIQIVDDESITVEGVTKDVTTSPVTLLVGGEEAAIDEHGQFSHTVPLRVGENYITVTATDKAGLSSSFRLYVIRLITDRSQADIEELLTILSKEDQTEEELIQLAQTSYKGAYNETDMNRVTTAAEFLSDSLFSRGYVNPYVPVNPEPGRDYWVKKDKPTLEQSEGYVSNVKSYTANATNDSWVSNIQSAIRGKFITVSGEKDNGGSEGTNLVYIPDDAIVSYFENGVSLGYPYNYGFLVNKMQQVTGYPAIPAGTTIEYLGVLGEFGGASLGHIKYGSYVGTGTGTVTIPFKNKPLIGFLNADVTMFTDTNWVVPTGSSGISNYVGSATWSGGKLTLSKGSYSQFPNSSGETYKYVAFLEGE